MYSAGKNARGDRWSKRSRIRAATVANVAKYASDNESIQPDVLRLRRKKKIFTLLQSLGRQKKNDANREYNDVEKRRCTQHDWER